MEMKFNEVDAATDKRIVRSIMFGIFISKSNNIIISLDEMQIKVINKN